MAQSHDALSVDLPRNSNALPVRRAGEGNLALRFRGLGLACQAACGALCKPLPLNEVNDDEDKEQLQRQLCPVGLYVKAAASLPLDEVNAHEDEEQLQRQLCQARAKVRELRAEYNARCNRPIAPLPGWSSANSPSANSSSQTKPVKMFIDGVFDLMHFGHMNAFRQARSLGTYLIVGVNSDESVKRCKGSVPILTDEERQEAVAACRFVDEIVPASPYVMSEAYIEELTAKYGIDYFVHGDDPCIVDGKDVYEPVKTAGRFKSIPRTEGISTTDIAGRTLLLTKDHHKEVYAMKEDDETTQNSSAEQEAASGQFKCVSQQSRFLVTSQLVRAFSDSLPTLSLRQTERGRIVYVDGAWDMFHTGHISLLQKAKALGDFLIVGVHADAVVNHQRGFNYPILAMNERVLSVMGCRYVDDVLLDAPWFVTQEMVATLNIATVARGSVRDCAECPMLDPRDPHEVAIKLGIHTELESKTSITLGDIVKRLQGVRKEAEDRLATKHQKERAWYCEKHGLALGPA